MSAQSDRADIGIEVSAGAIVAFRLFDIAYEVDLARAEARWAASKHNGRSRSAIRSRLSATPPKAVAFGVPPVVLTTLLHKLSVVFDVTGLCRSVQGRVRSGSALGISSGSVGSAEAVAVRRLPVRTSSR